MTGTAIAAPTVWRHRRGPWRTRKEPSGWCAFTPSNGHIDPHKIGVLGFSAGGYLAAEISTKYRPRLYAPVDDADKESARPDFAVLVYPGHLAPARRTATP
ncbi:MAG: alpha/beta hydrolase fold domain-containing protein [Rhizomicrobium sp.]